MRRKNEMRQIRNAFIVVRRLYVDKMFVNGGELDGFLRRGGVDQELDPPVNDGEFLRNQPGGGAVLKLVGDVVEFGFEIETECSEHSKSSGEVPLLQLPPDRVESRVELGVG